MNFRDQEVHLFINGIEVQIQHFSIQITAPTYGMSSVREITVHGFLTDEMIEAARVTDEEVVKGLETIRDDLVMTAQQRLVFKAAVQKYMKMIQEPLSESWPLTEEIIAGLQAIKEDLE